MTLSVVSALARLGLDPWREAAQLTRLPKAQAIAALTALFGRLPGGHDATPDAAAQATRLIGLLPLITAAGARPPARPRRAARPRLGLGEICLLLVLGALAITLASQSYDSGNETPPAIAAPPEPPVR